MPEGTEKGLAREIQTAIAIPEKRESLYTCMKRGRDARTEAIAVLAGGDAFRKEVKAVKQRCISEQEGLLERFRENAERRGAKVYYATDAQAAIDYTLKVALERKVKTIAKSKSLTTEEIEINAPLEEAGFRVVETDLGELIIQLVSEKPYHLVFPSVHKTAEDVAKIFENETGEQVPSDIPGIMNVVRRYLRPIFLNTDIGMTGANVGIAETGAIVVETNEGNARLVSSIGDCHICIMGIEKIVETVEDAMLMVMAHPVSATGQCPTTYVTWMAGRSPLGDGEGQKRESHIIVLDNGRRAMREDPDMREALHCIRCGACMNICPTYGVVGGHTFGHIYPGPIAIPWTAQVHGLDKAAAFSPLCISCGLCKEICPADIDMPMMIARTKERAISEKLYDLSRAEKTLAAAEKLAALGSATAPISNWTLNNSLFRLLLEKFFGIDRRRKLPAFSRSPFLGRPGTRRRERSRGKGKRGVALFVDTFANYNRPDLAEAAVETLEAAGCEMVYPQQKASGYPRLAYGDLQRAREIARYNVDRFAPAALDGCDIVSLEPTAVYTLKHAYPKLLDESDDANLVASKAVEFFEYLLQIAPQTKTSELEGMRLGFHCSCHQRPLGSGRAAMDWLKSKGADCVLVETGTCCGMGGTFGLKAGQLGYELSNAVGEHLFDAFKRSGVDAIVTESSVCGMHLQEGTGLPVYFPLELVSLGKA